MHNSLELAFECLENAGYLVEKSKHKEHDFLHSIAYLNEDVHFDVITYLSESGVALQSCIPDIYPASDKAIAACLALMTRIAFIRFTIDAESETISLQIDMPTVPFPEKLFTEFMTVLPKIMLYDVLALLVHADPETTQAEVQAREQRIDKHRTKLEELFKRS